MTTINVDNKDGQVRIGFKADNVKDLRDGEQIYFELTPYEAYQLALLLQRTAYRPLISNEPKEDEVGSL